MNSFFTPTLSPPSATMLPGAGWQGFDPTNDKRVGREHIAVAVAREQEKAMPISGSWFGAPDDFAGLEVKVEVVAVPDALSPPPG